MSTGTIALIGVGLISAFLAWRGLRKWFDDTFSSG